MLAHERQAHERVPPLRAPGELGIALVPLPLRADEDAFARPHRFRQRVVTGDREAAERVDVLAVVAAHRDHVEPLAVLAQGRDQPGARLGRTHSFGEDRVEDFLRRPGRDERVGGPLETQRNIERLRLWRPPALGHGSCGRSRLSCSRSPLARRSSTSRTVPASASGSNGFTT